MSGSQDYSPPPGPPPSHYGTHSESRPGQPGGEGHVSFAPAGRTSEPPKTNPWHSVHIATSQGPHQSSSDGEYAPPPGPPPSYQTKEKDEPEPPPYDPWLAVPDNALLPPPPAFHDERSPATNAPEEEAQRAHDWCDRNPLWKPQTHSPQTLSRISHGQMALTAPPRTKYVQLHRSSVGDSSIQSEVKCKDTILLSDIPVYSAMTGAANSGTGKTIYFEIKLNSLGAEKGKHFRSDDPDAALAIGYVAPPYPSWRQPGWHRGSLGVHSDDGHRYMDDSYGGQEFTRPFKKGDVLGIGMIFSPPQYAGAKNKVEVFFTRNGKKDGAWNLHEERDREQDGGEVFGLEGEHDLLAAVGVFGAVKAEARFRRDTWAYKP